MVAKINVSAFNFMGDHYLLILFISP